MANETARYNALALDFGASSGRGIVGSYDGKRLTLREIHRFDNRPALIGGRLLWDAPALYNSMIDAITKCVHDKISISTLGIDTWGVDYAYIDKERHLLCNPVHYRDKRCSVARAEAESVVSWEELYGITGIQQLPFNSVYQLYYDAVHEPHIQRAASKLLFMPDLFNYFLSGVMASEYTVASTGAVLDARKRTYAVKMLSRLGIDTELFCELVEPSTRLGCLMPSVCEATGAGKIDVVTTASHDTASAVMAVPSDGENFVYISSGTWSLLGTELTQPLITDMSRSFGFTNEGGACGKIRLLKNIAGLWLEQESKRQWAREGKAYTYDELSSEASVSSPLRSIIDPDDEIFTPPGDMPGRIREYCARTGQAVPESAGELVRCIFDSLALRYRFCVDKIAEMKGSAVPCIHIVGGGVKEELLCRLTADACGVPVYAGPIEATAIGNIASQLMSAGEISCIKEARALIKSSFEIKEYLPDAKNAGMWNAAYDKFLSLIDKERCDI